MKHPEYVAKCRKCGRVSRPAADGWPNCWMLAQDGFYCPNCKEWRRRH